ncbi:MAG: hypothetical protein OCC45_09430 [Desulfotalea sp.]
MTNLNTQYISLEREMIGLFNNLDTDKFETPLQLIQFISAHKNEGVTTISREFATVSAKLFGKTVLLLEKHPDQSTIEGKAQEKDIPYYSITQTDAGYYTGSLSNSDHNLIWDKNNPQHLDSLRDKFDTIIIDAPSLAESAIGLSSSRAVDGVVLVVEAESTRWPVTVKAKNQIEKAGGNILGFILNKQQHYIPQFIYNHFL